MRPSRVMIKFKSRDMPSKFLMFKLKIILNKSLLFLQRQFLRLKGNLYSSTGYVGSRDPSKSQYEGRIKQLT